jgi:thioredoxin reductase (NADPH)
MDQESEVTILGAGPTGITAALYLIRAGFHPILLEAQKPGGLLRFAHLVENYPGFPRGITGTNLVELFVEQLNNQGLSITIAVVHHVHHEKKVFLIETDQGWFHSPVVIVATGTNPTKIRLKGSASLEGTHLFYDPFSIPHQVKKRILVIGAGDIAFDYSLTLLDKGHEVTIIARSEPTCLPLLRERVLNKGATFHTWCVPQEIVKDHTGLLVRCRRNDEKKGFHADFILIACGRYPNTSFLSPLLKNYLDTISDIPQTTLPGLYFAGDIVRGTYRQTGVAVGDGIRAAMMAERYLINRAVKP